MWIFTNLPQNVDKIPNSKGPRPITKKAVMALAVNLAGCLSYCPSVSILVNLLH